MPKLRWKTHLDTNPARPGFHDPYDPTYKATPACGVNGKRTVCWGPNDGQHISCKRCRAKARSL